jgi:hypothetical protein
VTAARDTLLGARVEREFMRRFTAAAHGDQRTVPSALRAAAAAYVAAREANASSLNDDAPAAGRGAR